jgi:hypothetical protein
MHGAQTEGERLMSTVSNRQLRLAVVEATSMEQAPLPLPALRRVELSLVPPTEQGAGPAWDPHEVWLNRVKKPRDARGG